jgi:outer membrane receptor for ferrienterochelin and colicin
LRFLLLVLIFNIHLLAKDLGKIEINADAISQKKQDSFKDVFKEVEYYENTEYVKSMPAQKRLSTDEAMFIPGVQGDPIKAVQSLSGVTSTSDTSGELFIYGSKPEESLTTINHLPIGYLFHMGGMHSVIAPDAIEQIDAYMAGFDVTYGDAMGGVINVTAKYPDNTYSGYGHLGIFDASAGVNVPVSEDVSFYLGARRSYFDLTLDAVGKSTGTLDEDTNTTYTEFPNYYDLTFIGKFQYDSANLFTLEVITAQDSLDIASEANKVKDPKATGQIKAQFGFTTVGLRHQGYYNNYETNSLIYNKKENYKTKLFDDYYFDLKQDEYGLFHQSSYTQGDHKLIGGVEIFKYFLPLKYSLPVGDDVTTSLITTTSVDLNILNSAVFLQDIYTINDELTLKYGARFTHTSYNNIGSATDPRLSLLYKLNDHSNISIATGKYTQTPEGRKTVNKDGNLNPDISYERATHYLLHYDNSYIDGLSFSVDGFYKKYDDLLVEDNIVDDNISNFANGGEGYAYGMDTNIKYKNDDYFAFLAYTYLRSKRELETKYNGEKFRFYGEIPHTLQLIGGMKIGNNWALSTRMNYHSGRPYTKIIDTSTYSDGRLEPIEEEPNSSRLPSYFSLNVKIAQELKLSKNESLEWSFEIMNLTNHDNITAITYDDDYNKDGVSKGLPLLPWFDVTYRF